MKLDDFDYDLPASAIAHHPAVPRHSARLLNLLGGGISDARVIDLPALLNPDDLLVVNNTKVIPARLIGKRGEARISITLHQQVSAGEWLIFAKPAKKLRLGDAVRFGGDFSAEVAEIGADGIRKLRFNREGVALMDALHQHGTMPLPPYIARPNGVEAADARDYQSIFARHEGAVAAPTASLHFDSALLDAIKTRGIPISAITLHVGAGTFLPVKSDNPSDHIMHKEWGAISPEAAEAINACHARGGRVVAVGTTCLRLLESCWQAQESYIQAREGGRIEAYQGETDLFILPGFKFNVVDVLMTNFHLPKSTLLMLVYAFAGAAHIRAGYQYALENGYRFFSYGDACLLGRCDV